MKVRIAILVLAVALAIWISVSSPLAGTSRDGMIALAIAPVVIGLWATVLVPEYTGALVLFTLAMLKQVAPASVVFAGFHSPALWLVFAGLVIGLCARRNARINYS